MRFLSVVLMTALVGSVVGDFDPFNEWKMIKKWMKVKSMEGCFGHDVMKTYMIKMKTATAKCAGQEPPMELGLPMFNNHHRVLQALINGAGKMGEKNTVDFLRQVHGGAGGFGKRKSAQQVQQAPGVTIVTIPTQQQAEQDPMEKFMKMMMHMKMMKMMHHMKKMKGAMGMDHDDDEDDEDDDFSVDDDEGREFDMDKMMKLMQSAMRRNVRNTRNRRDAGDLLDLGDKLNEKLQSKKEEFEMMLGNLTCILQEFRMVDEDMNLDLDGLLKEAADYEMEDKWLQTKMTEACRSCYSVAEAVPREVLKAYPLGEKWGKIREFMKCEKMAKYKNCILLDVKKKLEANFGSLDDLEAQTGMSENELLPLASKLLMDQMDDF